MTTPIYGINIVLKVAAFGMHLIIVLDERVVRRAVCLNSFKGFFSGFGGKGFNKSWDTHFSVVASGA